MSRTNDEVEVNDIVADSCVMILFLVVVFLFLVYHYCFVCNFLSLSTLLEMSSSLGASQDVIRFVFKFRNMIQYIMF